MTLSLWEKPNSYWRREEEGKKKGKGKGIGEGGGGRGRRRRRRRRRQNLRYQSRNPIIEEGVSAAPSGDEVFHPSLKWNWEFPLEPSLFVITAPHFASFGLNDAEGSTKNGVYASNI